MCAHCTHSIHTHTHMYCNSDSLSFLFWIMLAPLHHTHTIMYMITYTVSSSSRCLNSIMLSQADSQSLVDFIPWCCFHAHSTPSCYIYTEPCCLISPLLALLFYDGSSQSCWLIRVLLYMSLAGSFESFWLIRVLLAPLSLAGSYSTCMLPPLQHAEGVSPCSLVHADCWLHSSLLHASTQSGWLLSIMVTAFSLAGFFQFCMLPSIILDPNCVPHSLLHLQKVSHILCSGDVLYALSRRGSIS